MTIDDKIEILKDARNRINSLQLFGVCVAVYDAYVDYFSMPSESIDWFVDAKRFCKELGLKLPPAKYAEDIDSFTLVYSWPPNEDGDEQRRIFIEDRIIELEQEAFNLIK